MSTSQPLISVIIPTYNRGSILPHAIQSVMKQTYKNWEILIVDDGSRDNTQEILNQWTNPRIRYILHSQNKGLSAARNTGLKEAQGEYIAFLDDDDQWLPEKLEKQLQAFEREEVGVVYTWSYFIDTEYNIKKIRRCDQRGDLKENLIYRNWLGSPSTVIIRADCLKKGACFDLNLTYCEEWDFYLQIAQDYQFEVIPEPLIYYLDDSRPVTQQSRLSQNSKAVINGYFTFLDRYHPKSVQEFKKIGNLSLKQKTDSLFDIGRRLVCNAEVINHQEAFELGCYYLKLAYQLNPLQMRFLSHYLIALMGSKSYVKLTKIEANILRNAAQIFRNNKK